MAKEKERDKDSKKLFIYGISWNCGAELKILLTALLVLCSLATLVQFIPFRFSLTASDLRHCLSQSEDIDPHSKKLAARPLSVDELLVSSSSSYPLPAPPLSNSPQGPQPQITQPSPPPTPPPPPPSIITATNKREQTLPNGVVKRSFDAFGATAYNFILMSAYRGGLNTFAIIGLASKPLHVFGRPSYQCEWIPRHNHHNHHGVGGEPLSVAGEKILPDWGYGRVYTVVVVNCTFPVESAGGDGSGGKLVLHASTGGGGDSWLNLTDRIEALEEAPGSVNASAYGDGPRPKYDYLYCGSSLYGDLSPQRVREWMAYHARLFGGRSHFVIHDAGGIHEGVLEVLKPWMELGYVTLQDIRDQERFDGYYHNQFMVVNDCLHRYRFLAKWIFFFDVDEFIYVPPKNTLRSVLNSLSGYTQFTIEQMPMSSQLCHSSDAGQTFKKWGFEKLVYRDVKRGIRRDRKYAVQPRNVFATGVHMSQNLASRSKTNHKTERLIKYYHYHGTIAQRREPCQQLVNATQLTHDKIPYVLDTTMRSIAGAVKAFELRTIGPRLRRTHQ